MMYSSCSFYGRSEQGLESQCFITGNKSDIFKAFNVIPDSGDPSIHQIKEAYINPGLVRSIGTSTILMENYVGTLRLGGVICVNFESNGDCMVKVNYDRKFAYNARRGQQEGENLISFKSKIEFSYDKKNWLDKIVFGSQESAFAKISYNQYSNQYEMRLKSLNFSYAKSNEDIKELNWKEPKDFIVELNHKGEEKVTTFIQFTKDSLAVRDGGLLIMKVDYDIVPIVQSKYQIEDVERMMSGSFSPVEIFKSNLFEVYTHIGSGLLGGLLTFTIMISVIIVIVLFKRQKIYEEI